MIKEILQGMVIGLANIIPGVSGGTMMVAMGLYDKLIYSITHLKSNFKESVKFLLPIFIGAGAAILLLARLFEFLFDNYPIPTNLAFCGLILGSLPPILKNVQHKKVSPSCIVAGLVFFALVIFMAFESEGSTSSKVIELNFVEVIMMFIVGVIAAATMVIPGVSGSMVLMLMGYYQPILNLINTFLDDLAAFNVSGLLQTCGLLVPFGIGVLIGIFAIAKAIEWIFEHYRLQAYWAIIGLIAASPVAILMRTDWSTFSILMLVIGIAAFILGWFIAVKLSGEPEKQ